MADVKTDLLSLQYSQNFAIEGLQDQMWIWDCLLHPRRPPRCSVW